MPTHPFRTRTLATRSTAVAVGLSVAALTLGLAGPASAGSIEVSDPRDTAHGSDLRSVEVRNLERRVVVVTTHTNLRRDSASGSGGAVFLDTDPADKGPERVFVGGYFEGTDYQLLETDGFNRRTWGEPVEGSYELTLDYRGDRVVMRMSRAALGNPEDVRVAVTSSGTRSDGSGEAVVDWLGAPRSFTPWVARG
ncbi:hypothetical protein FE634_22150 [Nocardioides dongxiaopingii]|uniref:hypothetical protein n=1 Tax=Nocardioides TaxID=1839 RepID=UPI0010C7651B|nr:MULTISPECIES: hypothetical protein [Nocardioides]QDH11173.1 hypothetical protein FE634_22150 [Nocardioides sp. S-1144]